MRISDRLIEGTRRPYVIAEIGVNHDGDVGRAIELVKAAAHAGADAIKVQFFQTDRLLCGAARLAEYQVDAGARDPFSMLRGLELTIEEMGEIVRAAHICELHAIVTVFSLSLVEAAAALGWDAWKIASPDLINKPLLEEVARLDRPMIVSTGAAHADEVRRAIKWIEALRADYVLLQCVSAYPTPRDLAALDVIPTLGAMSRRPVGYSDHTADLDTGARAVEWGASILEKHLTYDRSAPGPDHAASLERDQFAEYVRRARMAAREAPTTSPRHQAAKLVLPIEEDVRIAARQSIVIVRDLPEGHILASGDLTIKRPGTGIEPWRLDAVVGQRLARAVESDRPLTDDDLAAFPMQATAAAAHAL